MEIAAHMENEELEACKWYSSFVKGEGPIGGGKEVVIGKGERGGVYRHSND